MRDAGDVSALWTHSLTRYTDVDDVTGDDQPENDGDDGSIRDNIDEQGSWRRSFQ